MAVHMKAGSPRGLFPSNAGAFAAFCGEAWPRQQFWRLIAGAVLTGVFLIVLIVAFVLFFQLAAGPAAAVALGRDGTAVTVLAMLVPMAIIPALGLALWLIHRRHLRTLFGAERRVNWRHFRNALAVSGLAGLCLAGFTVVSGQTLPGLALADWLQLLPLMLVLLFFQTTAEELLFRGYAMQQMGARFDSRFFWWLLPALVFGAMHLDFGTFGSNAWLVALAATLIGLIAGDLVARTGNLGAAMGLHFGNNIAALLLVGLPGPLSGVALRVADVDLSDSAAVRAGLISNITFLILAYAAWLGWLAWRGRLHSPRAGTS